MLKAQQQCPNRAPTASEQRSRPPLEKAQGLSDLSKAITNYGTALAKRAPPPPSQGQQPAAGQPSPAKKVRKQAGSKPGVAPKAKPGAVPKPGAKPRHAKPGAKPGAKLWESGDEESEESDDDDDNNDDEDDLEDGVYIVEAILAERADGPKARQYLVQWKGFEGEDTWEPLSMLKENSVFQAYMIENRKKAAAAKRPAAKPPAAKPPRAAEPPAAEPPAVPAELPAAEPPAAERRAAEPPAAERRAAEPPADEPPADKPPADKPPAAKRKPPAAKPPAAKRTTAAERTAAKRTAAAAAKPLATWEPTPGAPTPSSMGHVGGWGSSSDKAIPTGWPNGWPPSAWGAMYHCNAADPAPDLAEGLAAPQTLSFAMDPLSLNALSNLELEPAAPSNLIAPVAHEHAADEQPTKRQRKGSTKRIARIELDAEDGPPQIRMLPLEAGPFAGVWIADGEEFEIIGALINDSKAGEIYQQVMYRCTSGYIKSKYIRY